MSLRKLDTTSVKYSGFANHNSQILNIQYFTHDSI